MDNDPKVFKLGILLGDQKVKGQRSRLGLWLGLQKLIEGDRVASVSYGVYRVPSL